MDLPTRLAFALVGLAVCTAASPAQQPAPPSQPPSHRIYVDVVVTPKSGEPVPGLQKQSFTLLDNGVAQPIATFDALGGPQGPVEVVLLIDAVNTTVQDIAIELKQMDAFLKANDGHLAHPTALALVTDTGIQMQQGFSRDGNALSTQLGQYLISLRQIRRNSDWGELEMLQLSLNALNSLATKEAARPGRKIILWMSPGWPLLNGPMVDFGAKQAQQIFAQIVAMSTILRSGGITLYSIDPLSPGEDMNHANGYQGFLKGVTKPAQVQLGNLALQVLAIQSGGLALGPSNDIAQRLERCMADITAYYELSFDPPPADHRDEYHALQIKLSQPGLTARTRTGYYAQP